MRVAFVVQEVHKRGGTERAMAELAEALARRGHSIAFFSSARDPQVLPAAVWYRVPLVPRPHPLRYLSFLVSNTLVRALLRLRNADHFDVVHSTGPDVLFPTVTTLHCCTPAFADALGPGQPVPDWRRWAAPRRLVNRLSYLLIGVFERFVVRAGAGRVLVVSEALLREVQQHVTPGVERMCVVPNGVNLREFAPLPPGAGLQWRRGLGIPEARPVVLFVGYNWERKGLGTLASAMAMLRRGGTSVDPLLLVVGGRGSEAYERGVATLLDGHVRFLGSRSDMPRVYNASDVCVLPSLQEPFGLPPLEAMACARPVVVSRCAGVAELITDGVDGLLLNDPRDVEELAEKLGLLLRSPELRQEMGARARLTAEQYSWDEIARRVEAIYHEVLGFTAPVAATEAPHDGARIG